MRAKGYGKIFMSMFERSLAGAGADVFAVWAYILAEAQGGHFTEINPMLPACKIGMAPEDVVRVLERLQQEGLLVYEGAYLYSLPGQEDRPRKDMPGTIGNPYEG
jgi:hypothetical protein